MTYRRAGNLGFSVLIMIFLEGFRARYEMMAHGSPGRVQDGLYALYKNIFQHLHKMR